MKKTTSALLAGLLATSCVNTADTTTVVSNGPATFADLIGRTMNIELTYDETASEFWQLWTGFLTMPISTPDVGFIPLSGFPEFGIGWDGLDELECLTEPEGFIDYDEDTGVLIMDVVTDEITLRFTGVAETFTTTTYDSSVPPVSTVSTEVVGTWELISTICPGGFAGGVEGLMSAMIMPGEDTPEVLNLPAEDDAELVQVGELYELSDNGQGLEVRTHPVLQAQQP